VLLNLHLLDKLNSFASHIAHSPADELAMDVQKYPYAIRFGLHPLIRIFGASYCENQIHPPNGYRRRTDR
jgi:hypothetical protein